jgi:hypothetical protein
MHRSGPSITELRICVAHQEQDMCGNASSAMNEVLSGIRTDDKDVSLKASASIRVNSDSALNEIDESELQ